jgi:hypothetical protein
MRREILLRVIFLAVLGGGLLLWAGRRAPRELTLQIDLTGALPGEISEVDVVVRRSGRAIARHDVNYGKAGAPALVELPVHATTGEAEVETTLVYAGKPAHKSVQEVKLAEDAPARIKAR